MFIKLHYDLGQTITIKLFNNPAVTKWFSRYSTDDYFQTKVSTTSYDIFRHVQPFVCPPYNTRNWNAIISTLEDLKSLGYHVPFQVPNKFTKDQALINQLHRFFTYNVMWFDSDEPNPYDPNFQTNLSFKEWHDILDRINIAVHFLEVITTNQNKKILDTIPMKYLWFQIKHKSFDAVLEFDNEDQKHNLDYFKYQQHPLVLLDQSILGKSVLQSFLTNDDPSLKDCSGRSISHGGFVIDLNNSRSKIYQSSEFLSWCKKFNIDSPPLEFPIGYVTNPEKLPLVKLLRFRKAVFGAG